MINKNTKNKILKFIKYFIKFLLIIMAICVLFFVMYVIFCDPFEFLKCILRIIIAVLGGICLIFILDWVWSDE